MATHYEVLGVSMFAPPEDVRRAYLDLARALHPDRTHGAEPGQVEQTSRRMQEVNEAWRVLRDPATRAAYARAISGGRRIPRPASMRQPPPPVVDDELDRPFTSPVAQPGDLGVSVARALPWLTLAVILVAIFIFTAFAGKKNHTAGPRDLIGKCISSSSGSAVTPVACQGPNEGRVILVVDRSSLCPDGSTARAMEGTDWLCVSPVRAASTTTTAGTP